MNIDSLLLILLIPLLIPIISKSVFKNTITWGEFALHILVVSILITGAFIANISSQTSDTEIWNGYITGKDRIEDHYLDPYDCNCYTTCSGSGTTESCTETCSTCYEDRYTVDWTARSTIGEFEIKSLDSGSKSVYRTPDPKFYTQIKKGDPCSKAKEYTNYIKAVPESLFSSFNGESLSIQYQKIIPNYPKIYNHYSINRILDAGVKIPEINKHNLYLSEKLKTIGASKQANIIIINTSANDQNYRYALEYAWKGGKKNDIIVLIGSPEYPKISWVDTITLGSNAGNSLMTILIRDRLLDLGKIDNYNSVIDTITKTVIEKFDRKPMADYEYLKDEISPPEWFIWLLLGSGITVSLLLTWLTHKKDLFT